MANSETVDLMSIGQHCSAVGCGQVDFLPFKCDCCGKTYCLDHRTYEAHKCSEADSKQTEIIVCPLCASAIRLSPGEDPNTAFDLHQRTKCDTKNYARVHKKRTCPVQNCREKLTTVNTYSCKDCGLEICLKHRLPADHKCKAQQEVRRQAQRRKWSLFQPSDHKPSRPATKSPVKPKAVVISRERCELCGAHFPDIHQLNMHMEAFHPAGGSDRCPKCGKQFSSPVQLVDHVENQCRKSTCAIS